jgi:uncharacterized membrane protein HdeD (DUF308 family)
MLQVLARNWWVVALRGAFALAAGLAAFAWSGMTLTLLVQFFGAYALVDGVLAALSALGGDDASARAWLLVEGAVGIAAGLGPLIWPSMLASTLLYLVAAWAIVSGAIEVVAAAQLREGIDDDWLLALAGVSSMLFGVYLAASPADGAQVAVARIGVYAVVFGVLLLALGLRLRDLARSGLGRRRPRPVRLDLN